MTASRNFPLTANLFSARRRPGLQRRWVLVAFLCAQSGLGAEVTLTTGVSAGQNSGHQVLETGGRFPDLSGFAGGSRLTYPRTFRYGGLRLGLATGPLELGLHYLTTGWWHDVGQARNEDFTLDLTSTQRQNGFDPHTYAYRDTAYTISGGRNFADAKGETRFRWYRTGLSLRVFPWTDETEARAHGWFLAGGLDYSHYKYRVSDVQQYFELSGGPFFGPIGIGNSFSNDELLLSYGVGHRAFLGPLFLELRFLLLSGWNEGRDHHVQRAINFHIRDGLGSGLVTGPRLVYAEESWELSLDLEFRRYFSIARLDPDGGIGQEILRTTFSSGQTVWLSTKETSVELAASVRL
ncbi:MAG: putative porin [Spirochaetales bacterium]|nr:putative porin [Leptospiraceae bacterium]MCP5480899.1 putative porin [Spirochaetales bacterium]MCP5485279.1 putative porin [Spirochaetales bacterium]